MSEMKQNKKKTTTTTNPDFRRKKTSYQRYKQTSYNNKRVNTLGRCNTQKHICSEQNTPKIHEIKPDRIIKNSTIMDALISTLSIKDKKSSRLPTADRKVQQDYKPTACT